MKGQFCDRERVLQELFRSLEGLPRGRTCYRSLRGPRKGGKSGLFRPFVVPRVEFRERPTLNRFPVVQE